MTTRIGILIVIDVFFIVGLAILVFFDGGRHFAGILGCIGLIAYVSYSIVRLRAKANASVIAPDPTPPVDK